MKKQHKNELRRKPKATYGWAARKLFISVFDISNNAIPKESHQLI